MVLLVLTFLLSLGLSLFGTPLAIKAAKALNVVDRPDDNLKKHKEPVPYLGGLAIYVSFLLTLAMTFSFTKEVLGLLLAGNIVVLLGLIDDFGVLTPENKMFGQIIAIFALLKSGIMIKISILPVWISGPLSVFWLLGMTNGLNIIDVMDGLSGGISFIGSLFFLVIALRNGNMMIATVAAALAGSTLGFLRFNFSNARIYLGDAGSLFLGLMLGALAMIGDYSQNNGVSVLCPILILGVPIFDTFFVMYIRYKRGMSVFLGSRDHFALRLRKWRFTSKQTAAASYFVSSLFGVLALYMMRLDNWGAFWVFLGTICFSLLLGFFLKKIDMTM